MGIPHRRPSPRRRSPPSPPLLRLLRRLSPPSLSLPERPPSLSQAPPPHLPRTPPLSYFSLSLLLPSLSSSLRSSPDPLSDQFMISATSLFITTHSQSQDDPNYDNAIENLINILLSIVNRPSHGPDRQARVVACECLREIERARPCLLSGIAGPLWGLCVAERTHATQNYVLLLTNIIRNIVTLRPKLSALNTNGYIVPFSNNVIRDLGFGDEIPVLKEMRKVVSFLFECQSLLTSFGNLEFVSLMMDIGVEMGLQASLFKVQFSGMLYAMEPVMCHAYLTLYMRFAEAFGVEAADEVVRRLSAISKETQCFFIFRVLALHWVLGLVEKGGGSSVRKMVYGFYPNVFDPLALKSLKIDLLAYCSISCGEEEFLMQKLFEDGIVSVSAFKWLPSWSAETAVSLRAFHKFLIGTSSHDDTDLDSTRTLMLSPIFKTIQRSVVELTVECKGLVPVYVSFIDRLLCCDKHRWLGERLLQTFDEPKTNQIF